MQPSDHDLRAYLDEGLPPEAMAELEQQFRSDPKLVRRLAELVAQRDGGQHALGDIWRQHRLSCATRAQLETYLQRALPSDEAGYVEFHLSVVGCRWCRANLTDLESQQAEPPDRLQARRRRFFQSSAGYLSGRK